jgi:hypothetical protein
MAKCCEYATGVEFEIKFSQRMSKANKAFLNPSPQKSQKHHLFKGNSKLMGNEILALCKKIMKICNNA